MTNDLRKFGTIRRLLVFFVVIVTAIYIVLHAAIWCCSENKTSPFWSPIRSPYTNTTTPTVIVSAELPVPAVAIAESKEVITILFWTKYYGQDPSMHHLMTPITRGHPKCFKPCGLVTHHSYFNTSDAVIFHSRDLSLTDMPKARSSQQIWIYLERESPAYTAPNLGEFANVFNWTMTYRQDSDVPFPYGKISRSIESLPPDPEKQQNLKDILDGKLYPIYWIVSDCQTIGKRENFVTELKKYIPVHIYGKCGDRFCPGKGPGGCLSELAPYYKFYLSFENSICWDYATTELYNVLYNLTVIPIVYGGGDYDTLAPPHSVIDVKDFNSTEELANYLKFLDKNSTEYLKYFEWRREYQVTSENLEEHILEPWCDLCEKLVEQRRKPWMKSYVDLWTWWNFRKINITRSDTDSLPVCSNASASLPKTLPFVNATYLRSIPELNS